MRTLFTAGLIILLSANTFAQIDEKADEILSKFSNKTKKLKTLDAKFTFIQTSLDEGEINSFEGEIYIKDDMFKLVFPGNEIYSMDNTLWQYMMELNEVTITEKDKEDDSFLNDPKKIFSIYKEETVTEQIPDDDDPIWWTPNFYNSLSVEYESLRR